MTTIRSVSSNIGVRRLLNVIEVSLAETLGYSLNNTKANCFGEPDTMEVLFEKEDRPKITIEKLVTPQNRKQRRKELALYNRKRK